MKQVFLDRGKEVEYPVRVLKATVGGLTWQATWLRYGRQWRLVGTSKPLSKLFDDWPSPEQALARVSRLGIAAHLSEDEPYEEPKKPVTEVLPTVTEPKQGRKKWVNRGRSSN